LPEPRNPGQETLRALAQAGLSERGLRVISDRRTAKAVRAGLGEDARRRRADLKRRQRRAKVLAVVKATAPWDAITVVIAVLAYLVSHSLPVSAGVAGGVLILGLILRYAFRRKRAGPDKPPE
jgi:hypothetical protein